MIDGLSYIGYRRSERNKNVFTTFNPKENRENPFVFYESCTSDIDEACRVAKLAFKETRKLSKDSRASFLDSIAEEIMNLGDSLLEVYCLESGLTRSRAIVERTRTIYQLQSLASYLRSPSWHHISIDYAEPNRLPNPKVDIRKSYIPLGPIVVFGASNFPLAYSTAGGDTASALACGCPVIVKSHPLHAGTGELVSGAIIRAAKNSNMPDGIFSNLNIKDHSLAGYLVQKDEVKGVGFTGSITGGRALLDIASRRKEPIPVFAEMGSMNPIIITDKAISKNLEHWTAIIAESMINGAGQFCTNPGLIFVKDSEFAREFISRLGNEIEGKEAQCMLHPAIKTSYRKLKSEFIENSDYHELYSFESDNNFCDKTLLVVGGELFMNNPKFRQEVFGPFTVVVLYDNDNELLCLIEQLEGQLTGTIIAEEEEVDDLQSIIDQLQYRVGRVVFNGVPTGVEVCPSMNHGGPYPACTDSRFTAVGIDSVKRWLRPISYQNFPNVLLPTELKDE